MADDYRFDLERLPQGARDRVAEQLDLLEVHGGERDVAARVLAASRFVARWATRYPERFRTLLAEGFPCAIPDAELKLGAGAEELDSALRRARNQVMVCLGARQTLQQDTPQQTVAGLSLLAEELLKRTLDWHWDELVASRGQPMTADGEPVRPMIFALGKLGGGELNFSSDIDLIAAHTATGMAGDMAVDDFMARLIRRVTNSLATVQGEGFVFRVDWRLRPFGSQGAPSASLAALDSYFELHAREWERYAWQKARCIAGDVDAGEAWLETIRPFIYRRYIDFGQIAGLRAMKDEIDRDVRVRGREQDIKRGWGGIREMEFAVQAQQLVNGGARPSLRQRGFAASVAALQTEELMDAPFAERWLQHYWFLRRVENCWQAVDDAQSHVLPLDEEPRQRLLAALGFADWGDFEAALQHVRTQVRAHFLELFTPTEDADLPPPALALLRELETDAPQWPELFAEFAEPLDRFWKAARRRCSDGESRQQTFELGVRLLDLAPDTTTGLRVLPIVEAICGRVNYVSLLREHRDARRELVELCRRSGEIAAELARQPALLIELCTPESLYDPPSRLRLRAHIERQLSAIDAQDFEEQLDQLRRIRHSVALRIGAAEVVHALSLMRVSDHLTELAEEIVRGALNVATAQMRQRWPRMGELPFAVVAYGKLGGMELSYSSDLDLVFVYEDRPIEGVEQAPPVFYTRLAQKLIGALATRTAAGRCYEVDMRLRPNGNSGLLVTSLHAFSRYQQESAWTWEHQALVRARPIVGDPTVIDAFTALRAEVLCRSRDPVELKTEILEMRAKMRAELGPKDGHFDPKHSPGGMVDIEFFSQWLVLSHAHEHPSVTRFSDVLRVLESAAAQNILDTEAEQELAHRYRALRAQVHADSLDSAEEQVPPPPAPALLQTFYGV